MLTDFSAFDELKRAARRLKQQDISALFASDAQRAGDFVIEAAGLRLDYSKQLLDRDARASLLRLAQQAGIKERTQALYAGEHLNNTEDRPALHTLLRASESSSQPQRFAQVSEVRSRMQVWSERLNNGAHQGFSGRTITDVVNIGIGGSDLGPRMVSTALKPFWGRVACHYVANVDPQDLLSTLRHLNPETTLFIICSKSFATQETLSNALAAREWLLDAGATSATLQEHFVAVTTNITAAVEFGIAAHNCLPLWDWVGGRYSVWSAVGLSCAIAVGWDQFCEFLHGAENMDSHFATAEPEQNMPLLMSLLELWYCNFFAAGNHVVLPYDHSLTELPAFLQQLTMESNGKRVSANGTDLSYSSAPILWGSAGTMGQHSFHQLLHQGNRLCPVDFILPLTTHTELKQQHQQLVANCLAQSRAMMIGRNLAQAKEFLRDQSMAPQQIDRLAAHLVLPGNRPNSVISMKSLTPSTLGAVMALYEHRTFCSGQLWGINPFDQWGVELGKEIGVEILGQLTGGDANADNTDPSTVALLKQWRTYQEPN